MSVRRALQASAWVALLATTSIASAGGWHNGITRKLGIWYSDGYHAQEGCPTEKIRGYRASTYPGYSDGHGQDSYKQPASPFADQYRSYSRPSQSGSLPTGIEYDEPTGTELIERQPTPAKPGATVMPTAPNDPSIPTREGHSEARLPSSMFPLMPIR